MIADYLYFRIFLFNFLWFEIKNTMKNRARKKINIYIPIGLLYSGDSEKLMFLYIDFVVLLCVILLIDCCFVGVMGRCGGFLSVDMVLYVGLFRLMFRYWVVSRLFSEGFCQIGDFD